ncbi:MAG: hypothetical protein Q8L48_35195 [Archangium sp.]|nr:hypothetical protein [Archangium sp.]
MSRSVTLALAIALAPVLATAKPWQGIVPGGGSSELDVIGKFGEPTKRVTARGQMVLVYSGLQAIKGTVQAQFKCDPATKEVQRIDVYPEPVIDTAAIEKSYGKSCEATGGTEPCYWRKDTAQKHPYFLYPKLGLAIFFKDDDKTVLSFAFLPAQP